MNLIQSTQKNKTTRFNLVCGFVVALTASSVFSATLIDERTRASSSQTSVAEPRTNDQRVSEAPANNAKVTGNFSGKEWEEASPLPVASGSALPLAIIRLMPPNKPAIEIDATPEIAGMQVNWTMGTSRRQALQEIATKYNLNISIDGRSVKITSASRMQASYAESGQGQQSPMTAKNQEKPDTSAARNFSQPLFEVKLSDIKLSTAMNRWAKDTGMRIRWDADKHVLIGAPMIFNASSTFDAVAQALATPGIRNSEYPLEVCEYPNNPPLLRITRQGDQEKDCSIISK